LYLCLKGIPDELFSPLEFKGLVDLISQTEEFFPPFLKFAILKPLGTSGMKRRMRIPQH
jgi:hypothetical protein